MPSIVPNYLYTFFALTVIGTLLILAFSSFAVYVKNLPEEEQLKNLIAYVAANSCKLLSVADAEGTNSTVQIVLDLPITIGHNRYWIRLANDSSSVWVEGWLGGATNESGYRAYLPGKASASGQYIGGFGVAVLRCESTGTVPSLSLELLEG